MTVLVLQPSLKTDWCSSRMFRLHIAQPQLLAPKERVQPGLSSALVAFHRDARSDGFLPPLAVLIVKTQHGSEFAVALKQAASLLSLFHVVIPSLLTNITEYKLNAEIDTAFSEDPDLPLCFRPLTSRDYGEDLGLSQANFLQLYQHFESTRGKLLVSQKYSRVMDLSGLLNYRLTSGRTSQLVWEIRSMKPVIQLAYTTLVSGPAVPLKKCINCGKVYYDGHAKSEFCGTKCRNYYNMRAFRKRERES